MSGVGGEKEKLYDFLTIFSNIPNNQMYACVYVSVYISVYVAYACVYVSVYVTYACVCVYTHKGTHSWRPEVNTEHLPLSVPLLSPKRSILARLVDQKPQQSSCLQSPSTGSCRSIPLRLPIKWGWGSELRSSCLGRKHLPSEPPPQPQMEWF